MNNLPQKIADLADRFGVLPNQIIHDSAALAHAKIKPDHISASILIEANHIFRAALKKTMGRIGCYNAMIAPVFFDHSLPRLIYWAGYVGWTFEDCYCLSLKLGTIDFAPVRVRSWWSAGKNKSQGRPIRLTNEQRRKLLAKTI